MVMPIMTAGSGKWCLYSELCARVRLIKNSGSIPIAMPDHIEATLHNPAIIMQLSFDRFVDLRNITKVSVSGVLITLSLPDH